MRTAKVRVTAPAFISLEFGSKVELNNYGKDAVEGIDLQYPSTLAFLPPTARNIGALYEAFAMGGEYVGFEEAVYLHRHIAKIEEIDNRRINEKRKHEALAA